jgi:hypothetical protein
MSWPIGDGLPINLFTGQTTDGTSNTQTKGQGTNIYAGAEIPVFKNPLFPN